MEPTPAEVRARLRAAGRDVPTRGRISEAMMSDYETLAAGGPPGTTAGEPPAEPAAEARPQIGGPPARDRKTAGKSLAERIRPARGEA